MNGTSKNVKLNLLKGFACICVVFIHIAFPGMLGQIVKAASSYAVPIFFMIAGYYAYGRDSSVIKRRLIKITKVFVIAYSLFFLHNLSGAILRHMVGAWFVENFNRFTPIKYICFCTIDFAIPLWYLIAMIEVYILWLIVVKREKENALVKIPPFLFILRIVITTYCETMNLEYFWKMNFITCGLPWFLLGYYLNTPEAERIRKINSNILCIFVVTGCAIAIAPTAFSLPIKFNVIGSIPYAFGLFVLTLKNPEKSICKPMEFIGEHLSLYIYILHVLVSGIVVRACGVFGVDTQCDFFLYCKPIIVVFSTIFVSWIIYVLLETWKKRKIVR